MTINLYSMSVFFLASLLGLVTHWYKMSKRGQTVSTLIEYLFSDYPGRSASTVFVLIGVAFGAVQTGAADTIDLRILWGTLMNGELYMPSFNALIGAFTIGWVTDSSVNKGYDARAI